MMIKYIHLDKYTCRQIPVLVKFKLFFSSSIYFLTGWRMSSTLPMSPFLASRREVSQPPSLVKPMFIMAWSATWILGSGWEAVLGGADGVSVRLGYRDSGVESSAAFLSDTTVQSSSSSDGVLAFLDDWGSVSFSSSSCFSATSSCFPC